MNDEKKYEAQLSNPASYKIMAGAEFEETQLNCKQMNENPPLVAKVGNIRDDISEDLNNDFIENNYNRRKNSTDTENLSSSLSKHQLRCTTSSLSCCSSSSMTFSPYSSMESIATSSNGTQSTALPLSRMESQSTLNNGKTLLVRLPNEDQIERDSATEEQLARVRREIEEMEVNVATAAYSSELKRRRSRKDLVKVPIESSLAVAFHSKETGKAGDNDNVEDQIRRDTEQSDHSVIGLRIVDEDHRNYILMYDMLTGIRISVSKCQAKPSRPLTPDDFYSSHKMAFDLTGNDETPLSRYDFKFKDYAPWVFRSLREQFSIDAADYLVSLTGKYVLSELYSPGKSGSLFYYSQDYRFIIKTIRESEHRFLRKILPRYHQNILDQPDTLIVRFYGLHRVQLPQGSKIYFVVMGNLFPNDRPMRSIYDLKGSTHGRWNSEEESVNRNNSLSDTTIESGNFNRKGPGPVVLKDLNWLGKREKLVLGPIKATQLMNQLKADCRFLAKLKIMDYSLLIGLHTLPESDRMSPKPPSSSDFMFYKDFKGFQSSFENNQDGPEVYYLGIIDILTPYSLTKKIEHTFKSIIFPKDSISAVNPPDYARRFLKFMSDNILQNVESDYSRRILPRIPDLVEEFKQDGETDGFFDVNYEED